MLPVSRVYVSKSATLFRGRIVITVNEHYAYHSCRPKNEKSCYGFAFYSHVLELAALRSKYYGKKKRTFLDTLSAMRQ